MLGYGPLNAFRYVSWFDVLGIEPTIPQVVALPEQAARYQWSTEDDYPPHLKSIPSKDQTSLIQIFNVIGLLGVSTVLPKIVPKKQFLGTFSAWLYEKVNDAVHGEVYEGVTIADIERASRSNKKSGTDIMKGDNIGLLDDWWSDARFAQQSFTGTNPNTITAASNEWIKIFVQGAEDQGRNDAAEIISKAKAGTLFVQDASYFRDAVRVGKEDILVSKDPGMDDRFQYASVTLFSLSDSGALHPLAIILDWRGSLQKSVAVFNRRLQPAGRFYATPSQSEKNDWPWRFAKTAAQTADWLRHEVTVHLTHAHFIEEATIVAANRTLPSSHPVYKLLEPHWFRTLSLNAAARSTLVPSVVIELIGLSPAQAKVFIRHAFDTFDFTGSYVPNDLKSRGFPPEELESNPKYRNYSYARNIVLSWRAIHTFVSQMLDLDYSTDDSIASDQNLQNWSAEIRSPKAGGMPSFPQLKTKADLIDAVTMCIHIAAPQHTAVNYLQNFYQAFVIAKPPALYIPPPTSLSELQAFKESDLVRALPISRQREWLLASQVPWLLSFRVADDYNLVSYAASVYNIYKKKTGNNGRDQKVKAIAEDFYSKLRLLVEVFARQSREQDSGAVPYIVLDPGTTAVSILI